MADVDFNEWFSHFSGTGKPPHEWQRLLAAETQPRTRLIRIPTGMGKTLGVLGAWAWHRLHRGDDSWPKRLVWCLPMRVLVEQTRDVVGGALGRLASVWDGSTDHAGKVGVHLLMGGVEPGGAWNLFPEECAVLIGTQDMLLSRALNRGYASGRARWPLEFGLLSHDALWIMDEVQLMDVGLATSAQLQAYHDQDSGKGFRPRNAWWMSATLQPAWLRSADTEPHYPAWVRDPSMVPPEQRETALGSIPKALDLASIAHTDPKAFAQRILSEHAEIAGGDAGRITLVVCNTVQRACETFREVRKLAPHQQAELVHSRFRPEERVRWRQRFLSRDACVAGVDRVIVATQVVEAGVDISAGCLVTDLAPWSSLVQRFGRCARYGGAGRCVVVDRGHDDKTAPPYSASELQTAWDALRRLDRGVGLAQLETFEDGLDDEGRRALYPYEPRHLLLRREFEELFDTTPDLTGADLDISRFIRTGEERDLQVFWLDVPKSTKADPRPSPSRHRQPHSAELCALPFLLARDWLCGEESQKTRRPRLHPRMRAWVWDWSDGVWVVADRSMLTPGRVVCVASECGGYDVDRGFDSDSLDAVSPVPSLSLPPVVEAEGEADGSDAGDGLSVADWKTIGCHSLEVTDIADDIANASALPANIRKTLKLAGRWHDVGKGHPAFQGAIRHDQRPDRQDLAKAPRQAWPRPPKSYATADGRDLRPGLRHELASALSLFAVLAHYQPGHPALLGPWLDAFRLMDGTVSLDSSGSTPSAFEEAVLGCSADEFDLLVYLVACHHGKVRAALHAGPRDQDYRDPGDGRGLPIRGVRDGDVLPSMRLGPSDQQLPPLRLTLEPAALGLSLHTGRSWRERTLDLVDRFGPGALAWLEALFRAADCRASMLTTIDPELAPEESPR